MAADGERIGEVPVRHRGPARDAEREHGTTFDISVGPDGTRVTLRSGHPLWCRRAAGRRRRTVTGASPSPPGGPI
ncbi:hypothetical protein ABZ901_21020 [Actinacidiphila alni]|uniref:hypothetical protein n=1 Tax=Actinacidiphila alni TaxID=380248 RepID=UPI0033EFFC49